MSAEDKKTPRPEINFLPPLKMTLSFFDRESRPRRKQADDEQKESQEKTVNKLIEKLSEIEE